MARFWNRKTWRRLGLIFGLAVLLLNVLAFRQAWCMTHFTARGARTRPPESLSAPEKVWVLLAGVTLPHPENQVTPKDSGLAYETLTLTNRNGLRLEVWRIPAPALPGSTNAGTVVMGHGYGASKASLLPGARILHDLGHETWLVDFPGSGGSDGRATSIGYHEAADVALVCQAARARHPQGRLVVFGESMGAAAALKAVQDGLAVDALIVASPFDRLLNTVENRFTAMNLPAFPMAPLLMLWGGVQQGFNTFAHNPASYAESVHCPVLFLQGEHDPRVHTAEARVVYNRLPGPKRFKLFTDVGHRSFATASPEEWRRAVDFFLQSLPPLTAGAPPGKTAAAPTNPPAL